MSDKLQEALIKCLWSADYINDRDFNFRGAIDNIGTNFKILTEDHL